MFYVAGQYIMNVYILESSSYDITLALTTCLNPVNGEKTILLSDTFLCKTLHSEGQMYLQYKQALASLFIKCFLYTQLISIINHIKTLSPPWVRLPPRFTVHPCCFIPPTCFSVRHLRTRTAVPRHAGCRHDFDHRL